MDNSGIDVWVASHGGCMSNWVADKLIVGGIQTRSPIYSSKGCHPYEPVPLNNIKCCIFLWSKDLVTCLMSQTRRGLSQTNYNKIRNSALNENPCGDHIDLVFDQIANFVFPQNEISYPIMTINVERMEHAWPLVLKNLDQFGLNTYKVPSFQRRNRKTTPLIENLPLSEEQSEKYQDIQKYPDFALNLCKSP